MHTVDPVSRFIPARDGLMLHVRCYGEHNNALPVICLPGLTRTTADFDAVALALADHVIHPRRVIALDYRGRGQSGYDPNPANYSLPVDLADVMTVLTTLAACPAVFIGTSSGGILTMLLATLRPDAIAGVVLNDIGPVIEPEGLMRVRSYVGKLRQPNNLVEAADILRGIFGTAFTKLSADDWLANARRTFKEEDGRLVPTYDVKLAKTFEAIDFRLLPSLWMAFDKLVNVPVMLIRGANSDLLSAATVELMCRHHPSLEVIEVPDQGHAPLLSAPDLVERIVEFVACVPPLQRKRNKLINIKLLMFNAFVKYKLRPKPRSC